MPSITIAVDSMLKDLSKLNSSMNAEAAKAVKYYGKYFFLNTRKEAKKFAPTAEQITAKFNSLKAFTYGRNKKGKLKMGGREAELKRRISRIGVYAKGWRFWKYIKTSTSISYWIQDSVTYADKQEALHAPATIAAAKLQTRFNAAMQKTMEKTLASF